MIRSIGKRAAIGAISLLPAGCAQVTNPSFPITTQEARQDLDRMAAARKALERPLVLIGGITDPGVVPLIVSWRLNSITTDDRIIAIGMGDCFSFDGCRKKVIDAIEKKFPSADPGQTVEVDVIGFSMGGLVARYASLPDAAGKRLRIARLFTISSPLSGAVGAEQVPPLHPLIAPMRPGSDLLKKVNAHEPAYPVYSYVRLGDWPVGERNATLPGHTPWWVSTPFFGRPHNGAMFDNRILADIARRLREEPGLASDPPAPFPAG